MQVSDGYIFFSNGNVIYRIGADGTGKMQIAKEALNIVGLNVSGGWIYYSVTGQGENKLFKIRCDGSEKTRFKLNASDLGEAGGKKSFFGAGPSDAELELYKADITDINVAGEYIYFKTRRSDGYGGVMFLKIKTDGTGFKIATG